MFPVNTIIAWKINIYHEHGNMIITILLLPLGHNSNTRCSRREFGRRRRQASVASQICHWNEARKLDPCKPYHGTNQYDLERPIRNLAEEKSNRLFQAVPQ